MVNLDKHSKAEFLFDAVTENKLAMERNQSVRQTSTDAISEREVSEEQEHELEQGVEDSKPLSKRRRLLMKHRVDTPVDDAIRAEIDSYLQVKSTDVDDDDPLAFWKETKDYDNLKQLAAVILTRSASSVQVECMFSTMGLILNGKRSRLSAQSADALSFIHDNFFLIE